MKKYLSWMTCQLAMGLVLASCTMFDSEYLEDKVDDPVPTYTGVGYDAPLEDKGEGYDVTYQYQGNVRVLTADYNPYVTEAVFDSTGYMGYITIAPNAPFYMRPVKGEILTCTNTIDVLPYGLGHEVYTAGYASDGSYRVFLIPASLEDIFAKLNVSADLNAVAAARRTRADETQWQEDLNVNIPEAPISIGNSNLSVTITPLQSYVNNHITMSLDLSNWWFPYLTFTDEMRSKINLDIAASLKGSVDFIPETLREDMLKGAGTIIVGPIVVRVFVPLSFTLSGSVTAHTVLHFVEDYDFKLKYDPTTVVMMTTPVTGVLAHMKALSESKQVKREFSWDGFDISGDFTLSVTPGVGIGFFTKGFSLRTYMSLDLANIHIPLLTSDKNGVYDLTKNPAVDFNFLNLGIKGGVYIQRVLKNAYKEALDDVGDQLDGLQNLMNYYAKKDEAVSNYAENRRVELLEQTLNEKYKTAGKTEKDNQEMASDWNFEIGPATTGYLDTENWCWFPQIDDKTFSIYPSEAGGSVTVQKTEAKLRLKQTGIKVTWGARYSLGLEVLDPQTKKTKIYQEKRKRQIDNDFDKKRSLYFNFGEDLKPDLNYVITPVLLVDGDVLGRYKSQEYHYTQPSTFINEKSHEVKVVKAVWDGKYGDYDIDVRFKLAVNLWVYPQEYEVIEFGIDVENYGDLDYRRKASPKTDTKYEVTFEVMHYWLDKGDKGNKKHTFKLKPWMKVKDVNQNSGTRIIYGTEAVYDLELDESDRSWEKNADKI